MRETRRALLHRLLWRSLLGGAVIAGAVAMLAGCQDRDQVSTEKVELSDLRAMVMPRDELGLLAIGLRVSDSSGWKRNRTAADESLDPHDTGRSLAKSGRLGGYSLVYSRPRGFAADEERPLLVSTEVELFRDDATASSYLRGEVARAMRLRGRTLPQGKIAAVDRFGGGEVGDESEGIRSTVVIDDFVGYGTTVGFRRGRTVASVSVLNQVDSGGPGDVLRIAGALDDRIGRVASGALVEAAAKLPKAKWWHAVPDPRPLTLEGEQLARGAARTHRHYLRTRVALVYWREYELDRGPLGSSRIIWLRTMTQAFRSARLARRDQAYVASAGGSRSITHRLLRGWFRRTGFRPTNVEARPLPASDQDTSGFQAFFDVPRGRAKAVLVSVRRGRLTGSVAVFGLAREVRPEDVLALRGKLRARLEAA
jgi:hypothetical protein